MRHTAIGIAVMLLLATLAYGQDPFEGTTMISPQNGNQTYAKDMNGTTISTWTGASSPASFAYLLPDGSIMRPCQYNGGYFSGAALGGRFQRFSASGTLTWNYYFASEDYQQHHDIQPMPNGNVLAIAWERKTRSEAVAAGRQNINGEMWPTLIAEIEPVGSSSGNIVWEWHLWDHLIQDVDSSKPSYGVVADHPELIDINYGSLGHGGGSGDWIHANSVDYDEHLDQIVFSSKPFNEFFVIDHSTTTEEAAGHTGGNHGMGGDILYRWGNPQVYDRGDSSDRYFYVIHGVNWIHCGLPGAGNILAFNNGTRGGSGSNYSSAVEIDPPRDADGHYVIESGEPFGPDTPVWWYGDQGDFYGGDTQCGAYRLPNGNTLICSANSGYVFEVTEDGDTVWSYDHPASVARAPRYWLIDLDDFDEFATCESGPDSPADCITRDTDCDDDVDLEDFARLQVRFDTYVGP